MMIILLAVYSPFSDRVGIKVVININIIICIGTVGGGQGAC